jgi:hypothetical protein
MAITYNTNEVFNEFKKRGGKTKFESSLKQVLDWSKNNEDIFDISDLAYLLATASAESDYSLQRWESDYQCDGAGIPYKDKPCQKALDYYRSTQGGKKNYYTLGTDKNGLPYFGRGLIQLTGKGNYDTYGKLIGVNLVDNGDLALEPKNSYRIALAFLNRKRGGIYSKAGLKRSTFDLARAGELTLARKSVNGGTKGVDKVNKSYEMWLDILKGLAKSTTATKKKKNLITGIIVISLLAVAGGLTYWYLSKKKII